MGYGFCLSRTRCNPNISWLIITIITQTPRIASCLMINWVCLKMSRRRLLDSVKVCFHWNCKSMVHDQQILHHIPGHHLTNKSKFLIPLLPRTKLNVVVQVKPWLYLKTLIDCWYIGHTKGQKRMTFPLSLIESVNQSSKLWINNCGFHAQVFDWFSRVFHCLFTGFSLSCHGYFTVVSRTFHALGLEWDLFETLESGIYLYTILY